MMKLPQKVHRISDLGIKHVKSAKTSKGTKKPVGKIINDFEVIICSPAENSTAVAHSKIDEQSSDLKNDSLDIRKPETTEWKSLKKIDYLRLETVLEEGQLSNEEVISRSCEECQAKKSEADVADVDSNKNKFSPIDEGDTVAKKESEGEEEDKEMSRESDKQSIQENEKGTIESEKSKADVDVVTVSFSISKKGLIPSGKMEILPIFSNDRFQCSRDAISIGECDDLCPTEKNTKENKFDQEENYEETEIKNYSESAPATKNASVLAERKLRFKSFTEKHMPHTHSHFINSLLVLAPFSEERKHLLNEKIANLNSAVEERFQLPEESTSDFKKWSASTSFVDEGTNPFRANGACVCQI